MNCSIGFVTSRKIMNGGNGKYSCSSNETMKIRDGCSHAMCIAICMLRVLFGPISRHWPFGRNAQLRNENERRPKRISCEMTSACYNCIKLLQTENWIGTKPLCLFLCGPSLALAWCISFASDTVCSRDSYYRHRAGGPSLCPLSLSWDHPPPNHIFHLVIFFSNVVQTWHPVPLGCPVNECVLLLERNFYFSFLRLFPKPFYSVQTRSLSILLVRSFAYTLSLSPVRSHTRCRCVQF